MPAPPDPGDLTDVSAVELFLALPSGNADEAMLQSLITAVSAEIVTYCERSFMWQAFTETRNGNGRTTMSFANTPCSSVQSVEIDGLEVRAAADFISSGYAFDEEQIYVRGTCFSRGAQNIVIGYTAGYFTPGQKALGQTQPALVPSLPADLAMAACELAAMRYRQSKRWGDTGVGIGPERISYFVGEMAASTQIKLNRYRKVVRVEA